MKATISSALLWAALALAGPLAAVSADNGPNIPPFPADDPEVEAMWREGHRLERDGAYLESAAIYEDIVERLPDAGHVYWRIARNHYLFARTLPFAQKDRRIEHFTLCEEWAARGIEAQESCAECYLYKFVGLSRVATSRGIFSSARHASEMAELLDRAIELGPTWVDNEWNSELGNLYYAAGVFYRSVPTSSMLRWTIGVRGDRQRSIEYLRKANEISPKRIDYHIELGASLLCAGNEDDAEDLLAEGARILRRIPQLEDLQASDPIDRRAAPILLAQPEKACDYSREEFAALEAS